MCESKHEVLVQVCDSRSVGQDYVYRCESKLL